MKSLHTLIAAIFIFTSCNSGKQPEKASEMALKDPVQTQPVDGNKRAYFASGCFWCVEAIFESVNGVKEAVSGYSGGNEKNPTYKEVSYGRTGHAEAVEVFYDPEVVDFETLVRVFFGSQDPTTPNRQGPDRGKQYRSIAFYQNDEEKKIIEDVIEELNQTTFDGEIVAEVVPFQKFWEAEGYHQNYERLHPNEPYIRNVSIPRINRFKAKFPELLKKGAAH